jgi:hypothetical protein
MKIRAYAAAALALAALTAGAEVKNGINHTPVTCVRAGELPLLQVDARGEGELRGYFRRINTTDWCSVEGTNDGPLSRVVLPKFEAGDEIEYFFVLIDGVRVVARSPRIYRVRVNGECETAFARHIIRLSLSCGEDDQAVPSSMAAGYRVGDEIVKRNPPKISPDKPEAQPKP